MAGTPWAILSCAARPSSPPGPGHAPGCAAAGHASLPPAGVGGQQGLELQALLGGAGVGIGQRARGAHGGAGAATHAQVGVHLDLLAALVAADGFGRADVHAGIATHGCRCGCGRRAFACRQRTWASRTRPPARAASSGAHVTPVPAEIALGQRVLQKVGVASAGRRSSTRSKRSLVRDGLAGEIDRPRHLAHLDAGAVRLAGGPGRSGSPARWRFRGRRPRRRCSGCTGPGRSGCPPPSAAQRLPASPQARDAPAQHRKTPCLRARPRCRGPG
jgi:hypothetical protein